MSKLWGLVFDAMDVAEKTVDRLRGGNATRRKLDTVPTPPPVRDPFAPVADARAPGEPEKPIGDPAVPVQVFGRRTCSWSGRVVLLLTDRQIEHVYKDLDADVMLETRLVRETKQQTVPYVYLRGEFIGGYNAIAEIDRLGQLEERLMSPEERRSHGIRIEIPKREPEERPPGER